jgi:hypothetical protein
MVIIWLLFTVMLFVFEPRARRRQSNVAEKHVSAKTIIRIQSIHWILLSLSLVTIAGAVAGSHGWLMFGS